MLRNHRPKRLYPSNFLWALLRRGTGLSHGQHLSVNISLALCTLGVTLAHADTIYRCGEAYNTSSQCGNAAATEVKPSSILHTTGQDKYNTGTSDLREAQTLEKQRLQAERQATQSAPIRLSTPSTAPTSTASNEPLTNTPKRHGKHPRKANSPYFTAVDPNAAPKKKSTAKAVPATSTSSP
jgi:hypothetical protein